MKQKYEIEFRPDEKGNHCIYVNGENSEHMLLHPIGKTQNVIIANSLSVTLLTKESLTKNHIDYIIEELEKLRDTLNKNA